MEKYSSILLDLMQVQSRTEAALSRWQDLIETYMGAMSDPALIKNAVFAACSENTNQYTIIRQQTITISKNILCNAFIIPTIISQQTMVSHAGNLFECANLLLSTSLETLHATLDRPV